MFKKIKTKKHTTKHIILKYGEKGWGTKCSSRAKIRAPYHEVYYIYY